MPKRAAEDPLDHQVMEMVDSLKDKMPDGFYLIFCSALKGVHNEMEEWDELVEEWDHKVFEGKLMLQGITSNGDSLLPHITFDPEKIAAARLLLQLIKISEATARKARADRREMKKETNEWFKTMLVRLRDIAA